MIEDSQHYIMIIELDAAHKNNKRHQPIPLGGTNEF